MPVPPLVVDANGISGPDYPTILAALIADFQSIYGSDIDVDPDTQDGQMIAIFAQSAYDCYQACIAVYNSFSPATAQGVNLSSNVKINGLARLISTNSQANITIVGVYGTVITNGIVGDNLNLNTQWALPTSVTIPIGGSIVETATCTTPGSTAAAPGTLTNILTPTYGWQSATNAAAATAGNPVESDAQLRQRQAASTSLPALTNLGAIYAAIANISGVTRLFIYENDTNSADINGIPGHSVCAVVYGGTTTDITAAIAAKKAPGTGTYGDISETVIDSHGIPDVINYYALTITNIDVVVNIVALGGFAATTEIQIQQAISAYVNALSIGEPSYLLRLVAPGNLEGEHAVAGTGLSEASLDILSATFTVISVAQCLHGGSPVALNLPINFNAAAACPIANVIVNVVTFLTMVSTASTNLGNGQVYTQTNAAAGGTVPAYVYSYTGTLPTGCTLNTSTGTVSGTLTAAGTFDYTVTVTDGGTPPQTVSNPTTAVITP